MAQNKTGRTLSVLLIDKEEVYINPVREAMRDYMNERGKEKYSVFAFDYAATPEKGLEIARRDKPYLIILDLHFGQERRCPEYDEPDGIGKVLKPLKAEGFEGKIICWDYDKELRWDARDAGADEFVCKLEHGLHRAINVVVKNHQSMTGGM